MACPFLTFHCQLPSSYSSTRTTRSVFENKKNTHKTSPTTNNGDGSYAKPTTSFLPPPCIPSQIPSQLSPQLISTPSPQTLNLSHPPPISSTQSLTMRGIQLWFHDSIASENTFHDSRDLTNFGGLFLESPVVFPDSGSVTLIPCKSNFDLVSLSGSLDSSSSSSHYWSSNSILSRKADVKKRCVALFGDGFLSVSLSVRGNDGGFVHDGENTEMEILKEEKEKLESHGTGAMNTTKHLWSGAVAAMVSRTIVAPLERLKLEYIVLGEQKNLFDLINTIATNQGLKGFWKGNFVNILRTAPFKAINFYAYDTYRKQLLKMTGNEETTNFERFLAGAASGITATLLCLPMDTIRTKMVAPGGEALGGVIGAFSHMIQTEGFFSLYKGLVPSIISMAPSGAVFYGVYDILKSAHLHSPEGRKRLQQMSEQGQDANAFDQMELGPMRTLLYGAIAGACAEAATYPFEVVRRQLQMQDQARKLSALATCSMIVEQRGIPALYAGLVPSLLQVLPSAAISYFVYEFMKIVLKVE